MATNFICSGDTMQWTNGGSAVASGDVVKIGTALLAVALEDIAGSATGTVGFGVFQVPKAAAATPVQGATLAWRPGDGKFYAASAETTGDIIGATAIAYEAGVNTATTMLVKFTGVPGAVK